MVTSAEPDRQPATTRRSTRGAKILTAVGAGVVAGPPEQAASTDIATPTTMT